ncbi:hypothetical protein EVAR_65518_1 [Eumeta japonica]|uniref:Uncharacterized protein n=1 Tax=Eumeta variegata TaxID=151549 RepID=A0A4C1ZIQ5_EUMVA|nr:hypothetical protein EVAR_65518_1 [Eumeta japonica]
MGAGRRRAPGPACGRRYARLGAVGVRARRPLSWGPPCAVFEAVRRAASRGRAQGGSTLSARRQQRGEGPGAGGARAGGARDRRRLPAARDAPDAPGAACGQRIRIHEDARAPAGSRDWRRNELRGYETTPDWELTAGGYDGELFIVRRYRTRRRALIRQTLIPSARGGEGEHTCSARREPLTITSWMRTPHCNIKRLTLSFSNKN